MKLFSQLIKLFIISVFINTTIFANLAMHGTLTSAQEVILKPLNGHALSITRTAGKYMSNSSFDFTMLSNNSVIYKDQNQFEDIYLVFHDQVLSSDRIKIHVNRGYFNYAITPLSTLPKVVKSVLDPEVMHPTHTPKKKHNNQKAPVQKKHNNQKAPVQKKHVNTSAAKTVKQAQRSTNEAQVTKPVYTSQTSTAMKPPLSDSFFQKFTQIFKKLVAALTINQHAKTEQPAMKQSAKAVSNPSTHPSTKKTVAAVKPIQKSTGMLEHFDDQALKNAAKVEERRFKKEKSGITNTFNDTALKNQATLTKSQFRAPKRGISEKFDDQNIRQSARISPKQFQPAKKLDLESSHLPATIEEKYKAALQTPPQAYHDTLNKAVESVPTFTDTAPAIENKTVPETVQPVIQPVTLPKPIAQKQAAEPQVNIPKQTLNNKPTYPDTGYKEGYEDLNPKPAAKPKARKRVLEDQTLPQNSARISGDDSGQKLVITKLIDKEKKEDPFAGRVLGRMDDRVIGNSERESAARLGMRVTKNSRPVSAWIEVFKNGTKQRVKTFYTSKSRRPKTVKLPEGVYMVRATYRTRDNKQQKTIKNIRLKEGSNVNRKIAFSDGKLRIIARRGDKALYVKVIVYTSNTHRRVGYSFSSRTSGIAELTLGSGRYDVEILEHNKNRSFDGIQIKGGKTNTLHVNF